MSIDSTSLSTISRKKTLKSILSQSDDYSHSRHSLKDHLRQSLINNRAMSTAEEHSGDRLTDLSPLPYIPDQQINIKRCRRFSELKPSLFQQTHGTNSERRNSTSQINFSFLLPNAFRSNKHQHKNTTKDETNTSIDTSNNFCSLSFNETMAIRTEPPFSSKILNTNINGSRTNLSVSNDTLSSSSHEDLTSSQFILETSNSEPRSADTFMLELNTPLCIAEIYREHFYEYFHINYCGECQQEGPFIASLRYFYTKSDDTSSNCVVARAIIRIPSRNYDVCVMVDGTNEDNILQLLFNKAHLSTIHTYKSIGDPKANEKIYLFDKSNDERQNCKIGLIYQRSDQTDEADIFNNDYLSDDMFNFLQILADRVRLKGFEKYRGDLDIKNDLHGEYSYYTQYNNHEIMFNIAPMIPSIKTNGQCVKRKGLVGNSFVCIVFQESDAEFIPDFISGKVTQIYITVQPIKINEQVYYKVGIWRRHDVASIIDPPGGIYECDKSFRDYFLTLLLNSINVAIESPSLRFCISEQRQRKKQEELKKLSQNLSIGQILDTIPDVDNTNSHVLRNGNAINSTTQSMNDSGTPNPGRMSPAPSKKRTFSKIFGVFGNRSGSVSIPSNIPNNDTSPITPTSPEVNTVQIRTGLPSGKEPVKRAVSVKHRPAPSPPVPPRIPISYMRSLASTQSSALPLPSSHSNVPDTFGPTNHNLPSSNNISDSSVHEEPMRHRSNSSPGDNVNMTTKRPLSTVSRTSKEISDTSSSIGELSDDEFSDEERYEHRPTLTESSLVLSSNTKS